MRALLIPVKDPTHAKTRLAGLLSEDERRRLAWSMFEDVSRAVVNARKPERVVIVTSFGPAVEHARKLGWGIPFEKTQASASASIDWASRVLSDQGCESVMRLPADLPLVTPEDIDALLSVEFGSPGALLVPSRDGTGTNAIIRTPRDLFPSRFGPNSLALHKQEAAQVGVACLIIENDRIALDIDEPDDVEVLLECGRDTRAFDVIRESRFWETRVGVR